MHASSVFIGHSPVNCRRFMALAAVSSWHAACFDYAQLEPERTTHMVKLTWLPSWKAYSVRRDGRIVGMIVCKVPLPFRQVVEFV